MNYRQLNDEEIRMFDKALFASMTKIETIPERRMTKRDPLWVRILVWPFLFVVAIVMLTGCTEPACVPNLSEDADGGPAGVCK